MMSGGTNDPDGKIAKENAKRKVQEKKAAKRRAEKKGEEEKAAKRRAEKSAARTELIEGKQRNGRIYHNPHRYRYKSCYKKC